MRVIKMMLVLMLALAVSACGASGGAKNSGSPSAGDGKPGQAGTEKTIQHALGTAALKKKPERVVVLFNGGVDIVIALGVKPVGAVESWDQKPWYNYLRPQMEGVKNLGDETQPNVEAILALKPDLIIGAKSRHEKIYPQLNSIAPTVIVEELFNWKENMKIAADALSKQDEAAKFLSDWDQRVAEFKQKAGGKLSNTEVSLIRFEKDGSARIYVTGFAGTIFNELGLSRPKSQQLEGKSVVNLTSKEQMSQLDGDFIFDITQSGSDPNHAKSQSEWTAHPLWKGLKGVKNDKYFKVDAITWNLSGGALAAKALLDDLYKYFDIQ
ncbi:ABC transporter substrate-binding protein [Paenibacillus rigui]|uniref:ABC transporter substrate-binding protein n=1 Tax=Paenibacillus rigui TaxID=554312 RepID=A0A229UQQ0_9BACL|nr:iron-siderophore ABC transporter substrate-binding protein [Paenibacillus rigui]OXM85740.1 ABC transporter substrate-binding protein [Paenibacillus rigui]